jgi:hypothetical protein
MLKYEYQDSPTRENQRRVTPHGALTAETGRSARVSSTGAPRINR